MRIKRIFNNISGDENKDKTQLMGLILSKIQLAQKHKTKLPYTAKGYNL